MSVSSIITGTFQTFVGVVPLSLTASPFCEACFICYSLVGTSPKIALISYDVRRADRTRPWPHPCSPHHHWQCRFHKSASNCQRTPKRKPTNYPCNSIQPFYALQYDKVKVEVVATKPSLTFYSEEEIKKAGSRMWTDDDEWSVSTYITMTIAELYTAI